jgi:hypothetical protein
MKPPSGGFRKCAACKLTNPNEPETPPHKAIQTPRRPRPPSPSPDCVAPPRAREYLRCPRVGRRPRARDGRGRARHRGGRRAYGEWVPVARAREEASSSRGQDLIPRRQDLSSPADNTVIGVVIRAAKRVRLYLYGSWPSAEVSERGLRRFCVCHRCASDRGIVGPHGSGRSRGSSQWGAAEPRPSRLR